MYFLSQCILKLYFNNVTDILQGRLYSFDQTVKGKCNIKRFQKPKILHWEILTFSYKSGQVVINKTLFFLQHHVVPVLLCQWSSLCMAAMRGPCHHARQGLREIFKASRRQIKCFYTTYICPRGIFFQSDLRGY